MQHISVLSKEIIDYLAIKSAGTYVDATLGAAGHSKMIADQLSAQGHLIAFDVDEISIDYARTALSDAACRIDLVHANFRNMTKELQALGVNHVDGILFDLGWNMDQFDDPDRGFSFRHDGPLDMRLGSPDDGSLELSASIIVNTWQEDSLEAILSGYADERYARRIAAAIIRARQTNPIETTNQLVGVIQGAVPVSYTRKKIHYATKTFQALRIAVNDEIEALREVVPQALSLLRSDGRLAVITFHSTEDRVIKTAFREAERVGQGKRLLKKGVTASERELAENSRSRSARLRVFEKQ